MSVLRSQSNLMKLWDQAGPGYAGKGLWGAAAAPPPAVNLGWNPADADPNVVLTNGNLTMNIAPAGQSGGVRSVESKSSGVLYFEIFSENASSGLYSAFYFGVVNALMSLTTDVFTQPGTAKFGTTRPDGLWSVQGNVFNPGNTLIQAGAGVSGTMGFVIDFAAGTLQSYGPGPAGGPGGTLRNTAVGVDTSEPMFIYAFCNFNTNLFTLRTTAAEFVYPTPGQVIPAGSTPWDA